MGKDLVFDLSPTQSKFVHSDAEIVILRGPMGEGKTYAAVAAMIRHAQRCGRNIRCAIVRDTHQNIKISTVPDIKEILGARVTFHDDNKLMIIRTNPKVECDLFGIDDEASLSKLQGPQYALIWLEEPAPIIERANAGLPRDVFEMSIARAARQTGTRMRVQITQNPADEEHWTETVANEPEIVASDPATGVSIRKEVYNIVYGENKYLNPQSRAANIAAFKSDPGKYARYVQGRAAPVMRGEKVTPEYNPVIHFADHILPVIPGAIGIRGYDAWHHPAVVIGQLIPPGKLWVHDAVTAAGIGMKELLNHYVIPLLNSPKYQNIIMDWRDIGDPSMRTPDQSSVTRSTAKVVEDVLNTRFEPGPTRWANRIGPLKTALTTNAVDGSGPIIQISKSAHALHRALNGGWHWKTDNNKKVIGNTPVKDTYADLGDAFSYPVSVIYAYQRPQQGKQKKHTNPMALANSYATRGVDTRFPVPEAERRIPIAM